MTEQFFKSFRFQHIDMVASGLPSGEVDKVMKSKPSTQVQLKLWKPVEVMQEFRRALVSLSHATSQELPLTGRNFTFVKPRDLRPQTRQEKRYLTNSYGDYILNNSAGECVRNPNGTFTIKLGYLGLENVHSISSVIKTAAHEYGHTLGDEIPASVYEELKAYTFASMFMRTYTGDENYSLSPNRYHRNLHSTALYRLEQLLTFQISEAEILAHLTGDTFCQSQPNDYMQKLVTTS